MASSRHGILAALRFALRQPMAVQPPQAAAACPGKSVDSADPAAVLEQLRAGLKALDAAFEIARSPQRAVAVVKRLVREYEVEAVLRWEHERLAAIGLDQALEESGVQIVDPAGKTPADLDLVGMGITAVDAALADSCSLVLGCDPSRPRLASLLPPVHLAVLRAEDVYADLACLPDMVRSLAKGELLPSAVTAITGPSSTADIELISVKGVHGPLKLFVLALDF